MSNYYVIILYVGVRSWDDSEERKYLQAEAKYEGEKRNKCKFEPINGPGGGPWGFHPCDTTEPLPSHGSEVRPKEYLIRYYFRRVDVTDPGPLKPTAEASSEF